MVAPHPLLWTVEQDYSGGREGVTVTHAGWCGMADRHNVLIVQPYGHGRANDLACFAYEGQVQDMAALPAIVAGQGYRVDPQRLYACGLSMGGMEAATLAGHYPHLVTTVCIFNATVDLAVRWLLCHRKVVG